MALNYWLYEFRLSFPTARKTNCVIPAYERDGQNVAKLVQRINRVSYRIGGRAVQKTNDGAHEACLHEAFREGRPAKTSMRVFRACAAQALRLRRAP